MFLDEAMLAFERRALLVIFDAILPPGAHPKLPHGARDIPIHRFFDDAERDAPFDFMLGLRASLWVIWLCPLFAIGRFRTFGGLSQGERLRVLRWLQARPLYFLREMPSIAKTVACLAYCGLPQVQKAIGIERVDKSPPSWARGASSPALLGSRNHAAESARASLEGERPQ